MYTIMILLCHKFVDIITLEVSWHVQINDMIGIIIVKIGA